jgi:ABC-type branched-subunit amino acid transport system ATPase component
VRPPPSGRGNRAAIANEDVTRRSVAWRRRQGMARSFQRTSVFQDLTSMNSFIWLRSISAMTGSTT